MNIAAVKTTATTKVVRSIQRVNSITCAHYTINNYSGRYRAVVDDEWRCPTNVSERLVIVADQCLYAVA